MLRRIGTRLCSTAAPSASNEVARVAITGSTGVIGSVLADSLSVPTLRNHYRPEVFRMVRHLPRQKDEIYWNPYEMHVDVEALEGMDAVIHLAGENVGSGSGPLAFTGRWTERKKHDIIESRRRGTQVLSKALASLNRPPKAFISMSGIGYYGHECGDTILDEAAPHGDGFLAQVARVWEEETAPARAAGIRTAIMRAGVVLTNRGGAVEKLLPPFQLGLGGPIGSGAQWLAWVSLADAVRAIEWAARTPTAQGVYNVVGPTPATNAQFATALGSALHRPAVLPLPEPVVRLVFGEMGEETLLASQRAVPGRLEAEGFTFRHRTVEEACRAAVTRSGGANELVDV